MNDADEFPSTLCHTRTEHNVVHSIWPYEDIRPRNGDEWLGRNFIFGSTRQSTIVPLRAIYLVYFIYTIF